MGVSQRAMLSVFKEAGIASKRKNRYRLNESYFERIDTANKAYFLGMIYADGYLGEVGIDNLILQLNDREILEEFAKELEFDGDIRVAGKGGYKNSKEGYRINFSCTKMATDLRALGVYSKKSLDLDEIPNIPTELKRHFLRGYFDGDGSVVLHKNRRVFGDKVYKYTKLSISIIATRKMLLDFVETFLITSYNLTQSKTPELFYLVVSSKAEVQRLYKLMYQDADIFLIRKYIKWTSSMSALELKCSRKMG